MLRGRPQFLWSLWTWRMIISWLGFTESFRKYYDYHPKYYPKYFYDILIIIIGMIIYDNHKIGMIIWDVIIILIIIHIHTIIMICNLDGKGHQLGCRVALANFAKRGLRVSLANLWGYMICPNHLSKVSKLCQKCVSSMSLHALHFDTQISHPTGHIKALEPFGTSGLPNNIHHLPNWNKLLGSWLA